jgi:hypothetical protein
MQVVEPDHLDDGSVVFDLRVDGRWARLIAGYATAPRKVRIAVKTRRPKCGEELKYDVKVTGRWWQMVCGGVLLDVSVFGPDGKPVPRFGWPSAPADGIAAFRIPVPVNARPGKYTIVVTAPQTGDSDRASFRIR